MGQVTILSLIFTCWIKQSLTTTATPGDMCTFVITSRPNRDLMGRLHCYNTECDVTVELTTYEACYFHFTGMGDCVENGCNRTFYLTESATTTDPTMTTDSNQNTDPNSHSASIATVCPTTTLEMNNSADSIQTVLTSYVVSGKQNNGNKKKLVTKFRSSGYQQDMYTKLEGENNICKETMTSTVYKTVVVNSVHYSTGPIPPNETIHFCKQTSSLKAALGVVIGLFLALLVAVSLGYIFIYWNMKKRQQISRRAQRGEFPKIQNTTNTIGPDKTLRRFSNPIYEDLEQEEFLTVEGSLSTPEHQEAGPTYEAIPLPDTINNGGLVKSGGMHRKGNSNKQQGASNGKSVVVDVHDKTRKDELEDNDTENNYHLLGEDIHCEKRKQKSTEENALNIEEDNYFLLSSADGDDTTEQTSKQEKRENDEEDFYTLLDDEGEVSEANKEVSDEDDNYALLGNTEEVSEDEKKQEKRESVKEDDYALLSNIEVTHEDTREKSVYQVLEIPADDNDYEDPDEGNLLQESFQLREEKSQLNDDYEVPCTAFLNIDKTDRR